MTLSDKLVAERYNWLKSVEGQNAIAKILEVCNPKYSNEKIKNAVTTTITLAYKAGSQAAVKVFTLENQN